MTIYWPEAQTAHYPGNENNQNIGFVLELPEEVLQRHGARMLRPATAVSVLDLDPPARSTAYMASVLLMPPNLVSDDGNRGALNGFLKDVGMQIPENSVDLERLEEIQPVLLRPVEGSRPVDVDAWTALLAIRKGNPAVGELIGLDHLMIASADFGGVPGAIQGVAPPFGFGGPVATGYLDGPVALEMPPIHRNAATLALGRPAVVAVLDTGIGVNDRLGIEPLNVTAPAANWPTGLHVTVDGEIQEAVRKAGQKLVADGLRVEVIEHAKDQPLTRNPLVGTQDWCFGHGTFIAGIIQQIAPDATVLAVRVMGSDGIARESDVVAALQALVKRVDRALASGDKSEMVDVVSLSLGYPYEGTVAQEKASLVAKQILELRRRGVLVVAAAGNSASAERFFPACMSTHTDDPEKPGGEPLPAGPRVINVGALNPNGSKALFTNEGPAVTCYATGTNVVSTFPQDANASRQPLVQVPADNRPDLPPYRQSPDVDDHTRSPFAIWTGSSFAAPHVAAHLANALHNVAPLVGTVSAQQAALNRAAAAVDAVKTAAAKL